MARSRQQREQHWLPDVFDKVQDMAGFPKATGWSPPRWPVPPHPAKIIAWVRGVKNTPVTRLEYYNDYHFHNIADDTARRGPWSGLVTAPRSGEPGYAEILAVDDGTLYTGGVANQVNRLQLQHVNQTNMFYCDRYDAGLAVYDLTLTAGELADVVAWFYCPVTHGFISRDRPNIVTHLGADVTHEWQS